MKQRRSTTRPGSPGSAIRGRRSGSKPWRAGDPREPIDFCATLNAGVTRWALARDSGRRRALSAADLHLQLRRRRPSRLIVFAIDTSDSMGDGPVTRMSAALGAIEALAARAYLNREKVCLITFRDRHARVVVPPTDSVMLIRQRLNRLPVGGATPLAAGLRKAGQVIAQARAKDQAIEPLLVLISDGEATMPQQPGTDPTQEALEIARQLRRELAPVLVIDTMPGHQQRTCMPQLAEALGTSCRHIQNLQTGLILQLIETTQAVSS